MLFRFQSRFQNQRRCTALPLFATLLFGTFSSVSALQAQNEEKVVVAHTGVEKMWTGGTHTEGVAISIDGIVYFCDSTLTDMPGNLAAGHIYRCDPRTKTATIFRSPANQPNGMKFDYQGRMLVAEGADGGGRRITRTDLTTGKGEILVAKYRGKPLNSPNDLTIDSQGRVYFTDSRYDGEESIDQPIQGLYRVDTDGSVHLLIAGIVPNGLGISPDGHTLYVAHHDVGATDTRNLSPDVNRRKVMRLLAYELRPDGSVSPKQPRVLVDYGQEEGADGLALDESGNIYAAVRAASRQGIRVYSPDGREIDFIPTPEKPTNVAFGRGEDARILYITAGGSLYRTRTTIAGYLLPPHQ